MSYVVQVEVAGLVGYLCRGRLVRKENATKFPHPSAARRAALSFRVNLQGHTETKMITANKFRFPMTYCSSCGKELGPGDSGVSDCRDHHPLKCKAKGCWRKTKAPSGFCFQHWLMQVKPEARGAA